MALVGTFLAYRLESPAQGGVSFSRHRTGAPTRAIRYRRGHGRHILIALVAIVVAVPLAKARRLISEYARVASSGR